METTASTFIRTFSQIVSGDIPIVGGKGANLGEMTHADLPVPPGFVVTASAYRAFVHSAAREKLFHILEEMHADDPEDVECQTERIRHLLLEQPVPGEIAAEVLEGYHHLSRVFTGGGKEYVPVAVRSSATAEDLPTASFAGQQDTYLNICGDDELLAHVRRCWASLWTARAVTYRIQQGFDHDKVALAVVVQVMVPSKVAGVLFTANPVSGNRDEAVLNASWGLGEAIVSGAVTPDTWIVRKSDRVILSGEIASKDLAIEYSPQGGTVELAVDASQRTLPSLSDEQILELVALGQKIEQHYSAPMDIEWGLAYGKMYVLQARQITTLKETINLPPGEYARTMFLEIFPDPLSPAFLSAVQPLFRTMLDFSFNMLGVTPQTDVPAVGEYRNQVYFHREYVAAALKGFGPALREQMLAQMVNPFGAHARGVPAELSTASVRMISRLVPFMMRFPNQLPGIVKRFRDEVAEFEAMEIENLSDAEIFTRITDLVFGSVSRLINYDYLMILLVRLTYQMLGGWLHRYFGESSEEVRTKLVTGVTGNVTMETNIALWDLAQMAKSYPTVRAAVRSGEPEIEARLEQSEEGRAFLAEFKRFLKTYGHREFKMDILYPTWGEEPAPVWSFLRSYLDLDPARGPRSHQEKLAQQREELSREVEAKVKCDLVGRIALWPVFHRILIDTQTHTRERDTMHFEFTRVLAPFRRLLLELGRRWTGKRYIDEPDDIFFLRLEEIDEMTKSPRPRQETVRERRAEYAYSQTHVAPPIIRDGQPIALAGVDQGEAREGEHRGIAGSPGVATGVLRVICEPEDFGKLQKGEILVAPLTNPVWTPLFAIAGGIITEVGGILSHGAIVAREYGIPAVMAIRDATRTFHDGQVVTVDGNRGIVTVEMPPPP